MRTQERRDETTLQIAAAMAVVALAVVLGVLATVALDAAVGLPDQGKDLAFGVTTTLAAVVVAARWLRRRRP